MGATEHLGIKFGSYDATIASLIPHYRQLIHAAASAVDIVAPTSPAVVDLGTGSGALAAEILKVRPKARLIGIDTDADLLATARRRLRGRIDTIHDNFELARIPRCDVVSASFALHHVDTGRKKGMLYRRCFTALRDGGMLVSADCFLASSSRLRQRNRQAWLDHLQQKYTKKKA
ncbi:MAG TPA: class I SAM-dependent methyltransferase, partial [Vicinamibacterales bacterium]|nr:class I SAM-dependent methyltransferase [Vicinamibacterales bacterium]